MKFTFRLLEILKDRKEKTRGLIQKIAARTGLERHQVAAMLYNKTQYISQEALGRICDFLVQEYKIDPQLLPAGNRLRKPRRTQGNGWSQTGPFAAVAGFEFELHGLLVQAHADRAPAAVSAGVIGRSPGTRLAVRDEHRPVAGIAMAGLDCCVNRPEMVPDPAGAFQVDAEEATQTTRRVTPRRLPSAEENQPRYVAESGAPARKATLPDAVE